VINIKDSAGGGRESIYREEYCSNPSSIFLSFYFMVFLISPLEYEYMVDATIFWVSIIGKLHKLEGSGLNKL
jgi:hypothetical protein